MFIPGLCFSIAVLAFFIADDTFYGLLLQYLVGVVISFALACTIQSFTHQYHQLDAHNTELEHEIQQDKQEKQLLRIMITHLRRDKNAAIEQNRETNARFEELQIQHNDSSARSREENLAAAGKYDILAAAYRFISEAHANAQRRIAILYVNVPEAAEALMTEPENWTGTVTRLTLDGRPDLRCRGSKHFGLHEERHYTLVEGRRTYIQVKMAAE